MSGEQFWLLRAVAGWSFYSNDVGGAYVKQNSPPQNGVPIPSKAVARLRSLAGDPLTRRNSRPVSLSEGAMALLAIAASAMAQAQQACAHEPEIQGDRLAISDPAAASAAMMASPLRQVPPGPPTDHRTMKLVKTIGGAISPKSVNASGTGLVLPAHDYCLRLGRRPPGDDPRQRQSRNAGRDRRSDGSGRACRGRLHPRRPLRVRFQLFHVRAWPGDPRK